jgi:uncharacterized membrane protein
MKTISYLQDSIEISDTLYTELIAEAAYFPIVYFIIVGLLILFIYGFRKYSNWIPNININRAYLIISYLMGITTILVVISCLICSIPLLIASISNPEYYIYLSLSQNL